MVKRPGVIDVPFDSNLQGVLAAAGGLLPCARANEVVLIRNENAKPSSNQYDLEKFFRESDLRQNPVLMEGDMVLITGAQIPATVIVFGEVCNPSIFTEFNGANIVHVILRAGSPTNDANVKNICFITPTDHKPGEINIDLEQFLDTATTASAPMVQAGDVIYAPKKTRIWPTVLSIARDVSTIAIGLYYIFQINN